VLSKIKRKPVILRPGGFELEVKSIYKKLFFYPILKRANGIIVMNPKMKEELTKVTKNRNIIILPHGISDTNSKIGRFKPNFSCLFVGRMIPLKNIDVIYRIAKLMPKVSFYLIGWGILENKFKSIEANNVHFLGRKTQEEVANYMNKCDILLLPSKKETFGRVIIEAMSHGMPVISTQCCGGAKTIITNGEDGYLVNSEDDEKEYKGRIQDIYLRYEMFSNNAIKKLQRYSWVNLIKEYEEFYGGVMERWKK